jgi:hypothetical protein
MVWSKADRLSWNMVISLIPSQGAEFAKAAQLERKTNLWKVL